MLPVPVMSLHPVDAVAVCAVLVIQTFPNQLPVASVFGAVQPSLGPRDSEYLFQRFVEAMEGTSDE